MVSRPPVVVIAPQPTPALHQAPAMLAYADAGWSGPVEINVPLENALLAFPALRERFKDRPGAWVRITHQGETRVNWRRL